MSPLSHSVTKQVSRKLSGLHRDILSKAAEHGEALIDPDQVPECGDLIRWGYAQVESNYGELSLRPTQQGLAALKDANE
ncbi:hypothetical protein [Bradyrhizobium sp. HKCCYLR1023]|uniref:hypothetical protein n=1 Tax=Bradyrhizobium TaxID=374 RepID=UPI003EB7C438